MAIAIAQFTITDFNDINISTTQPLSPTVDQLWLDTSLTPNVLKRWNGSAWVNSDYTATDVANYVASRGENLITNGTALMGTNYNFSSFTLDKSDSYGASGSFVDTISTTREIDEFMPVNPDLSYKLSIYAKQVKGSPEKALNGQYMFIDMFDADKLSIGAEMVTPFANTLTTLAQDLKVGDTIVYLANTANYQNNAGSSTHYRKFMFWGYKNSLGYLYPPETYTRYYSAYNTWSDGAVDYVNNTITLRVPWTRTNPNDAEGIWRAGQQVSNGTSGGYVYRGLSNTQVPEQWTCYTATIDKTGFRAGTAYIKLGWLDHYNAGQTSSTASTNNKIMYSNISFGLNIASQVDIDNMYNDNLLTPDEKQSMKLQLGAITGEKTIVDAQATTYAITTEKTNYDNNYTTLYNYLNPLLTDLTTSSSVTGTTLRSYFTNYYSNKATLLQKISDLSKSLTATAQGDATTAKTYTDNLASDVKITPDEKLSLKQEWDLIVAEGTATTGKIPAQAIVFGVDDTGFDTAYSALNTYLNTTLMVFTTMTATTTIVRATWDTTWKNYYNARTDLLNAISTKAKTLADSANTLATTANTLAGQKRRVFMVQPTVPYDLGDLWVSTLATGDTLVCTTARTTGSYTATDWTKDGTTQRIATAETKITPTAIMSTVSASSTYQNDLGSKITATQASTIAQTASNVQIGFNGIADGVVIDDTGILVNQGNYRLKEDNGTQIIMGSKENIVHDPSFESLTLIAGSWDTTYRDVSTFSNAFWTIVGTPKLANLPYGVTFGSNAISVTSANYIWGETYAYSVKSAQKYTISAFVTPHLYRNTVGSSINYNIKVEIIDENESVALTQNFSGNITTSFIATGTNKVNNNPVKRAIGTFTAPALTNLYYMRITLTSASTTQWVNFDGLQIVEGDYPSTFISEHEDSFSNMNNDMTGCVAHFATTATPTGWLKANGALISRTAYAQLFNVIGTTFGTGDGSTTFKLPDLRGQFLRSFSEGAGVDAARAFGSNQACAIQTHVHVQQIPAVISGYLGTLNGSLSDSSKTTCNTNSTGDVETRPYNVALQACIKY